MIGWIRSRALLLGLISALLGVGAAFIFGMKVGKDRQVAVQARLEQTLAEIERRTQKAVADQIAAIEVKQVTIQAKVHEVLREKTVYRDCVTDESVRVLLDEARAGGAQPAGDRQLP